MINHQKKTPQLGYTVDGITTSQKRQRRQKKDKSDDSVSFDFCPQCKETVELHSRENKYNPSKTVRICSKCGLIRNSSLWESLSL